MKRLVEIRSYRRKPGSEAAFHTSDLWNQGPRRSIVEHIESCHDTIVWLSGEALELLRRDLASAAKGN